MNQRYGIVWVGFVLVAFGAGCGSKGTDGSSGGGAGGKGTYPSFYKLAKDAIPSTGTGSALIRPGSRAQVSTHSTLLGDLGGGMTFFATFPTNYNTTQADFDEAFDTGQNYIGQVLYDAGKSGPVKSMFVLLAGADSTMEDLNTNFSDASGEPTNCTAISSSTTIKTPYFDTATNAQFNEWDDVGKYTCYAESGEGARKSIRLFGRQKIANPPSDCTDPYQYYVMEGYGADDTPNTEQVSTRGDKLDLAAIKKFYYDGCEKDLLLAFAHTTRYSAGVEFSSRSEIKGNTGDHSFSIRADYIDADTNYANHITIVGTGKSKVATDGSGAVHFLMGFREDNCGNSTSCSVSSAAATWCVRNEGTSNEYEMETDSTKCSSLNTEYASITALERSDIPSGYFDATKTAFGL